MSAMDAEPLRAATIFKALYQATASIRVKLEWARALYTAREYVAARRLFREILDEDLPIPVRDKVEAYVAEIDAIERPFSLGFGLVRDTNPRASPKEQQITLFGQTFDYTPAVKQRTESGLLTSLAYISPQAQNSWASFAAEINQYDYPSKANDRTVNKLTAMRRLPSLPGVGVGVSYEDTLLGYQSLYRAPSLLLDYSQALSFAWKLGLGYKRSWIEYPEYSYLNAQSDTFVLQLAWEVDPYLKLFVDTQHELNQTADALYTSKGSAWGLGAQWGIRRSPYQVTAKVSSNRRAYADMDPFFGVYRNDQRWSESVSITKRDFYVWGFRPSVDVMRDVNSSNIPINSYQKTLITVTVKKVF